MNSWKGKDVRAVIIISRFAREQETDANCIESSLNLVQVIDGVGTNNHVAAVWSQMIPNHVTEFVLAYRQHTNSTFAVGNRKFLHSDVIDEGRQT